MSYNNRQYLHVISKARCGKVNNSTSHIRDEVPGGDANMFLDAACSQARQMTWWELGLQEEKPNYYTYFIIDPDGRWKRYRDANAMALREQMVANLEILEDEIALGARFINHYAWDEQYHQRIQELNESRAAPPPELQDPEEDPQAEEDPTE